MSLYMRIHSWSLKAYTCSGNSSTITRHVHVAQIKGGKAMQSSMMARKRVGDVGCLCEQIAARL